MAKIVNHPLQNLALFHDYFAIHGGGERLALTLVEAFGAELFYGYYTEQSFPPEVFPPASQSLNLPFLFRRPGLRSMALAALFWRQRTKAIKYDTRLFSGIVSPFAAPKKSAGGYNIFYCHTPPRFLFDQKEHFMGRLPLPLRFLAPPVLKLFEWGYRRAIARMHVIVTNSENTRMRINKYIGRDAKVVFPPINTEHFVWQGQADYYLSTARLSSLKRVDKIVEAFLEMPDKKLIVASGGEDAEALQKKAGGAPNIKFCGWVSDDELLSLVGNAIATIYLPHDEDFGMSPVESMAAGKPVIGVAEGGLLETIVDGQTGILLPSEFTSSNLVTAVKNMTLGRAAEMRSACTEQAARFSQARFVAAIQAIIDRPTPNA